MTKSDILDLLAKRRYTENNINIVILSLSKDGKHAKLIIVRQAHYDNF